METEKRTILIRICFLFIFLYCFRAEGLELSMMMINIILIALTLFCVFSADLLIKIIRKLLVPCLLIILILPTLSEKKSEHRIILPTSLYENPESRRSPYVMKEMLKEKTSIENYSIGDFIRAVCRVYGVDGNLIIAQYQVESRFRPDAVSSRGAVGIAQLMPCVYRDIYDIDPYDPVQNMIAGIRYHAYLKNMFLGLPEEDQNKFVLASYNAGHGTILNLRSDLNTDQFDTIYNHLPSETRRYVYLVLDQYRRNINNT